ncbi:hypothetical protein [Flavobacterium sp. XGLA_31]|uniref:hypothetical protein n=1 Tax=Flavobacterium sp. XGLA_31 TaxID=3447666 RepID=UPI003F3F6975
MEEKVKDVYENIKERLSNPLIFSFIISWLIYNWEITIALFWYDKAQIKAEGCKSIFEFIQHQLNNKCYSLIIPLGLAVLYTFGMPYFKEFVDLMNRRAIIFGNKWKTKLLKDGLLLEISKLRGQLESINDTRLLEGNWSVTRFYEEQTESGNIVNKSEEHQVYISNRDYYIVENDARRRMYNISVFYFNPLHNDMLFKLKSYGYKGKGEVTFIEKDIFCSLKLVNGYWDNLSGMHNDTRVEYRKI